MLSFIFLSSVFFLLFSVFLVAMACRAVDGAVPLAFRWRRRAGGASLHGVVCIPHFIVCDSHTTFPPHVVFISGLYPVEYNPHNINANPTFPHHVETRLRHVSFVAAYRRRDNYHEQHAFVISPVPPYRCRNNYHEQHVSFIPGFAYPSHPGVVAFKPRFRLGHTFDVVRRFFHPRCNLISITRKIHPHPRGNFAYITMKKHTSFKGIFVTFENPFQACLHP